MTNCDLEQSAELPSFAQVLEQRLAAELRQHVNRVDSRVDEVAQDEIDDSVFPAERNGGFRPFPRERIKPSALTAGQYDAQRADSHIGSSKAYCSSKLRFPQVQFVRNVRLISACDFPDGTTRCP